MKVAFRKVVLPTAEALVGRRNVARFARFLTNEVRLDLPNDLTENGEGLVQATVLAHGEPDLVVFDVGANVGKWSASFLAHAADAGRGDFTVHAFEPTRGARAKLEPLAGKEPRLKVHAMALSSSKGRATIHGVGEAAGRNSLHAHPDLTATFSEDVETDTVAGMAARLGVERIALLKIDTEGHDAEVLGGALPLLEREAIDVAQFEYNFRWITARHYLRDVFELAPPAYALGKITRRGIEWYDAWHPELESFREGNYVLARRAWIPHFPAIPWWLAPRRPR